MKYIGKPCNVPVYKHRAYKSNDRLYSNPVTNDMSGYYKINERAHGNITRWDYCKCGAIRKTNINGIEVERGRWS